MRDLEALPLHKLPAALALLAAVACGGAVFGENIGGSPMLDRRASGLPQAVYTGTPGANRPSEAAPPDQYALDTPQGRVEIGELAMRGLYSQARFGGGAVFPEDLGPAYSDADLAYWDESDIAPAEDGLSEETAAEGPASEVSPLPVIALAQ